MKQYRVVRPCVGMPFNKRYFEKGEIIEVDDDVDPNSDCFELINKKDHVPVKEEDKNVETFKTIQEKNKASQLPKKGFAAGLNDPVLEKLTSSTATKIKKSR